MPVTKTSGQTRSVLRALAEPRRVAILSLIRRRELRAGQIAENFKTTRSAISQHLRVLTKAGLLSERRRGTSRLYRLRSEGFAQLRALLDTFWEDGLARLKSEAEKHVKGGAHR
jgi:DNA-binding transcriptional ArsR family regulator